MLLLTDFNIQFFLTFIHFPFLCAANNTNKSDRKPFQKCTAALIN